MVPQFARLGRAPMREGGRVRGPADALRLPTSWDLARSVQIAAAFLGRLLVARSRNAARRRWTFAVVACLAGLAWAIPAFSVTDLIVVVAVDDRINITEQANGFAISGTTDEDANIDVTIGEVGNTTSLPQVSTSLVSGTWVWSVNVLGNQTYIPETRTLRISVLATNRGNPNLDTTRTKLVPVDLTAPVISYGAAPSSLKVGVAITEMSVNRTDNDKDDGADGITYSSNNTLPPGLSVDNSGEISGTPTTANGSTQAVTVTATDAAGNTGTATMTFPLVAKGDQTLTGFGYSASTITFGDAAPTLTAPTVTVPLGTPGALSYASSDAAVCTVNSSSGALTIVGAGDCKITVTAAATSDGNYNEASDDFDLTVDKADQTLSGFAYSVSTITFGDAAPMLTAPTVTVPLGTPGALSYASSDAAVCTVNSSSGALTIVGAGDCKITVTAAATVNYNAASDDFDLTVNKADQTLSGFAYSESEITFGDAAPTLTAPTVTVPLGTPGALSYASSDAAVCTVNSSSGALTIVGAGLCRITVTAAATVNYNAASDSFDLNVTATVSIAVDDADAGGVDEGSDITFTIKLSGSPAAAVTVGYATSDATATAGSDYTAVDSSHRFEAGATGDDLTHSFTVATSDDSLAEGEETFTVTMTGAALPANVTLGTATATGTIIDDAEAAAAARQNRVNEEVLPRMAQAMAASTLSAVTGRMDAAVSGAAPTGLNLAGQSSLYHALKSNQRTLEDGTLSLTQVLGGSSFVLPLNAAENGGTGGLGGLAVWGRGDYRKLSGAEDSTVEWDGDIVSFHLGADMRVRPDLLAGLALSRSRGSFDYTDRTDLVVVGGSYESRMTSVHPYVNWSSPEGLGLWATVGYGEGEIEILDDVGGRESSDTNMKTAAVGASGKLLSDDDVLAGGTTALRLKGEGSLARVEVEGNGRINPLTSDVQRLRLSLEGSHERQFASGGRLIPSVEVGLRHDGGDAITGAGLEVGGALRYVDAASGLTLEGRGRVLLAHEEDYEDWGIGGLVRVDPGAEGRGLSFSLFPAWGDTASGVDRLWDQDVAELATDDTAANDNVPPMRLDSELGYGFGALGGRGLLTPYGGFALAGEGSQRYRIGGRFEIGPSLNLSLEGARREPANDDTAEHGVMLRLQASW